MVSASGSSANMYKVCMARSVIVEYSMPQFAVFLREYKHVSEAEDGILAVF